MIYKHFISYITSSDSQPMIDALAHRKKKVEAQQAARAAARAVHEDTDRE